MEQRKIVFAFGILALFLIVSFSSLTNAIECTNATKTLSNSTSLGFITTTNAKAHFLNITDIATYANITTNFTISLGGWDVYINNNLIGNITTLDTSPKTFNSTQSYLIVGLNNITYQPEASTTGTIDQTNTSYAYENLSYLTDGCTVSKSMTFAQVSYNFNGSNAGTQIIKPNANNIIIDCNSSTFTGNYTTGTAETGIRWSRPQGFSNVTYKNCILKDYYTGVGFVNTETSGAIINFTFNNTYQPVDITTGRNILIANSTFQKTDQYGIFLEPNSNLWHNITIDSNIFSANTQRAVRANGHTVNIAKGLIVKNNNITNGTTSSSLWIDYVNNVTLINNIIQAGQPAILNSEGIHLNVVSNVTISFNNISGYDKGISFITNGRQNNQASNTWSCGNLSSDVVLNNNLVFNNDKGVSIRGISNLQINNNTFLNNTNNVDSYSVQLYLEECNSNVMIQFNNFSKTGSTAIVGMAQNGLIIQNNTFDMLNDTEKTARLINDIFDYPSAIQISELYKSFLQSNRTEPVNISQVASMRSNNITIRNNIFDADTRTFAVLQGVSNYSTDFTNIWYRKWNPLTYLEDSFEYFNSNSYSRLYWTNSLGIIKDLSYYSYGNITTVYNKISVNFTTTWETFQNVDTILHNMTLYNSTNSLISFSNGTGYMCFNECNITLSPNISVTRLDNLNITEGSSRQFSPFWFSSITTTKKKIASNVTNTVNENVTLVIFTNGTIPDKPRYTSHSGAISKNYSASEYIYNASAQTLRLNISGIETASGSNELLIDGNATSIVLNSPENGSQDTDGVVRFIFTPTETNTISNCSLNYQNGIYTTLTGSITSGTQYVIEVTSIDSSHILYNDDLQWYITCTDNSGNVGSSSVNKLDTRQDVSGGNTGGGTPTGGTITEHNPKMIDYFYPETWNRGSEVQIKMKIYNSTNGLYQPSNITFQHTINGLSLQRTATDIDGSVLVDFAVSTTTDIGKKSINIIVTDGRVLEREIQFTVGDNIQIRGEAESFITEHINYKTLIIAGVIILLIVIVLIIVLSL